MSRVASPACAVAVLVALTACSGKEEKKGTPVARGETVVVTAEEFKAKLDEQSPFIRARYATLDRKKEFLENLIRFELLVAEARREKLDLDPEVQATLKKIMVQKLVRKRFDAKEGPAASDSDARAYYDTHPDEFQRPERVRVAMIFVKGPAGTPDRPRKAADARRVMTRLKLEGVKDPLAFGNMAREVSEDAATRNAGGDVGYGSRDELKGRYSAAVADAAFALKQVGQESDLVEAPEGFYILKLGVRQPGLSRGFDEVKPQLIARLSRERRTQEFDAFVKKLRESDRVQIVDAELEKIVVSGGASPQLGTPAAIPNAGSTAGTGARP
jgi:peptidyl-prolyl cis-trans isomerase C